MPFVKQTGEIAVDFIKEKYKDEKIGLESFSLRLKFRKPQQRGSTASLAALDEGGVNGETCF